MMGIKKVFKDVLKDIIKWANNDDIFADFNSSPQSIQSSGAIRKSARASNSLGDTNIGVNFTVYRANGGKVIELRSYDARTDRNISELYIVVDGEELGEELAQIITRDSLTR